MFKTYRLNTGGSRYRITFNQEIYNQYFIFPGFEINIITGNLDKRLTANNSCRATDSRVFYEKSFQIQLAICIFVGKNLPITHLSSRVMMQSG